MPAASSRLMGAQHDDPAAVAEPQLGAPGSAIGSAAGAPAAIAVAAAA